MRGETFEGKICKRGHTKRYVSSGRCVECTLNNKRKSDRKQYSSNRTKRRNYQTEWAWDNPKKSMLHAARRRAKKLGGICTLTENDVYIPEFCPCPLCGHRKLERDRGKPGGIESSPSLDRINPVLWYVPGNVIVICKECNSRKRDLTAEQHRLLADWLDLIK